VQSIPQPRGRSRPRSSSRARRAVLFNLYAEAGANKPEFRNETKWGRRYQSLFTMTGPNSRKAKVVAGWIIDKGRDRMRLTSAYVDK